ncbi:MULTISPECIES: tetratricopeptide repeat protein [Halomonadaceae]|uniref:Tetratricopeptide repeat protein n=1 Tax=Modicisalibacter zincidurans TaxID=1178777 RepID=A0ABP9QZI0_9GAMM|nr:MULTISPECIES: tetratricopeptide repeat protein [Halomonas]MCD6007668.1 tetratricopeptide repeat protein [Halomonas sp. IOP_31]MEA3250079.1 tetratricopeptide repeat protein [Pseudomonadota bacterium]
MRARLLVTVLAAALVAGCQGLADRPPPLTDPLASAPAVQKGLDAQSLATLLTAEIAGQRGDFERAARGYLETAERYESPALAERATLAARYTDDPQLQARAAEHWRRLAPQAEAPARLLANLALERGDWQASLEQRLALAERGGQGDLTGFAEAAIKKRIDVAPLIERLRRYLQARDGQPDAALATALLEAANGETARADARLDRLAESYPTLAGLWLARARIALQEGRNTDARDAALRGLENAGDDSRFILLLARAQLRLDQVESAEARINTLLAKNSDSVELRLALAQLYLEEAHPAPARRLLLALVDSQPTPPPLAFIMLGSIAEQAGEIDNALLYYRQVPTGDGFIEARQRAASMLADTGRLADARTFLRSERLRHPTAYAELIGLEVDLLQARDRIDAARQLLDQAVTRYPDDTPLRFTRSMFRYRQGNLAGMERDLRQIIEREPRNAMALNALGYTLADETSRLDEARKLIERAYRLQPESPAIIDSLGWVYHKLGDDQQALPYLREAYRLQPDQEIAAHLAEVLWRLERRDEARALIEEALERYAERPRVDALLERIPELDPTTITNTE